MKFKNHLFFICFFIVICSMQPTYGESSEYPDTAEERRRTSFGSILGRDKETGGVTIFGKTLGKSSKKEQSEQQNNATTTSTKQQTSKPKTSYNKTSIANSHLWHAALESVQSMPILVSDSSGGVLSTDWYENSDLPNERYKFNILIKSSKLSLNSFNVTAFKQKYVEGKWKDTKVSSEVANTMKNQIFAKAQKLKK